MNAVDCVLRLSSGFLTPVIAALAVCIAYQQYKTAHDKLRFDLYERRYRVFRGLMNLFAAVAANENVSQADLGNFYGETAERRFLFNSEIDDYLKLVRKKAVQLRQVNRKLDQQAKVSGDKRDADIAEEAELLGWFDQQIEEAETRFEAYLRFSKFL